MKHSYWIAVDFTYGGERIVAADDVIFDRPIRPEDLREVIEAFRVRVSISAHFRGVVTSIYAFEDASKVERGEL